MVRAATVGECPRHPNAVSGELYDNPTCRSRLSEVPGSGESPRTHSPWYSLWVAHQQCAMGTAALCLSRGVMAGFLRGYKRCVQRPVVGRIELHVAAASAHTGSQWRADRLVKQDRLRAGVHTDLNPCFRGGSVTRIGNDHGLPNDVGGTTFNALVVQAHRADTIRRRCARSPLSCDVSTAADRNARKTGIS